MPPGEATKPAAQPSADPEKTYRDLCNHYMRRQIVVYQHWPQRKLGPLGYSAQKVFLDQNA